MIKKQLVFIKLNVMKKVLIIFGIALLAIPILAMAAFFKADENVAAGEVVMGNLYLAGGSPVMAGTIQGDLYIVGGNVTISGKVTNDLVVAGGNVIITGEVGDDLRAFGGSVYVDGKVNGEVLLSGGDVKVGSRANIRKDMFLTGGMVSVDPEAKVYGKTTIYQDEGSEDALENMPMAGYMRGAFWIGALFTVLTYLVVAAVLMGVMPNIVKRFLVDSVSKDAFWKGLGLGLLILIVTPILAVICFITGIGALLGGIILILYVLYILLTLVLAGLLFGAVAKKLIMKTKKVEMDWMWGLGGIFALHILSLIPFVGIFIGAVFFLYALGSVTMVDWKLASSAK